MNPKQTSLAITLYVGFCGLLSLVGPMLVPSSASIASAATCGGVNTSLINCDQTGGDTKDVTQTGIWGILLFVLNIMTAGVGVLGVGGIVFASVLYASAGGNMEQTKRAKLIMFDVALGLVAYALMYSFINFIVPGGVFT